MFNVVLLSASVLLVANADALACAVCQGDPDSGMAKGAKAGVLLLALVTYGMLMGFVGIAACWIVRARRMR